MKKALVATLLILASVPLLVAMAKMPTAGSENAPAQTHIAPRYLEEGPEEAGAENIVTDIILNYRGFDTNGEVTVIFTALAAVVAVLVGTEHTRHDRRPGSDSEGEAVDTGVAANKAAAAQVPSSPVVAFIVSLLGPFIVVFSVYVILNGHLTPGGGFQGGTVLGALLIALSLVTDRERVKRLLPEGPRPLIQSAAPLMFVLVGVAGLVSLGSYLAFPAEHALAWLRTLMLLALEVGIGVGGAAIVASLFWTMEETQ